VNVKKSILILLFFWSINSCYAQIRSILEENSAVIKTLNKNILSEYKLIVDLLNIKVLSDSTANYPVTLHNYSEDTLRYHSMSCSWADCYQTDNPRVLVEINLCGKNVPKIITILPNDSNTVFLTLKSKAITNQEFKIGFKLLKVKESYNLWTFRIHEELKNAEIIWTELIY
jgi:hypothetical protein